MHAWLFHSALTSLHLELNASPDHSPPPGVVVAIIQPLQLFVIVCLQYIWTTKASIVVEAVIVTCTKLCIKACASSEQYKLLTTNSVSVYFPCTTCTALAELLLGLHGRYSHWNGTSSTGRKRQSCVRQGALMPMTCSCLIPCLLGPPCGQTCLRHPPQQQMAHSLYPQRRGMMQQPVLVRLTSVGTPCKGSPISGNDKGWPG